MSLSSETMKPVAADLDFGSDYSDVILLRQSPRGRIYSAVRAGKRFLLKAAADDRGRALAMLKREYELSLSLSHPGLAYVFTYESSSPVGPCIVMEYVDGVSLREFLQSEPSAALRRRLFAQLLDAVEYIHRRGVTHNDLSAENIIVTRSDGDVKLIDFGFADDDTHYLARTLGGTRAYASPELLEGGPTDARSDIYSLGVLMVGIFGRRYAAVSRRCRRREPSGRYDNVAALRRAWKGYFRPLHLVAAVLLAAALALFAVQFYQQRSVLRSQTALIQERGDTLAVYKSIVDDWYSSEIPQYLSSLDSIPNENARTLFYGEFMDRYNSFWSSLYSECPESVRPALTDYLVFKFNAEFPILK